MSKSIWIDPDETHATYGTFFGDHIQGDGYVEFVRREPCDTHPTRVNIDQSASEYEQGYQAGLVRGRAEVAAEFERIAHQMQRAKGLEKEVSDD